MPSTSSGLLRRLLLPDRETVIGAYRPPISFLRPYHRYTDPFRSFSHYTLRVLPITSRIEYCNSIEHPLKRCQGYLLYFIGFRWRPQRDLNPRPADSKSDALVQPELWGRWDSLIRMPTVSYYCLNERLARCDLPQELVWERISPLFLNRPYHVFPYIHRRLQS